MDEKKQIEEMAKEIESIHHCKGYADDRGCYFANSCTSCKNANETRAMVIAKRLYSAGYRKQSEGEWIDQYQGKYDNQLYKCSECGDTAFHDDKRWFLTPYCHKCGAKMKGGAE